MFLYIFNIFLWLQTARMSSDGCAPPNFPSTIPITTGTYQNWATNLKVTDLCIATPANDADVVTLANWAFQNGYKLRPSGYMHTWSPLTVTIDSNKQNVVLVDTTVNLNDIQPPTLISSSEYAVTVQTGASMLQFLTFLETYNLGVYAYPAVGDVTVGGVIAIGGHGTGIPYVGEVITPGHAYGSISNLVISFTAVVWNATSEIYVLKTFERSDIEAKAFLVNFGRTFITEVTLLVGLNYNLRCQSRTDLSSAVLFSPDQGSNTLSSFLNQSGRVEIIRFPFTDTPWVKVWTIEEDQPLLSTHVTSPFNYPFSDNYPEEVAILVGNITNGAWYLTPELGLTQLTVTQAGLLLSGADIWGPSKNLLLYLKSTTLRLTANGYTVITTRANIQRVVSTFVNFYDDLVDQYQQKGEFPFNGQMEIRVTSLDLPGVVTDGEPPSFSVIHPINDQSGYDVAVWMDILNVPNSSHSFEAFNILEQFLLKEFNGTYGILRPEWSKGWAYTNDSAWSNEYFYRTYVPSTFPSTNATNGWNWAVSILDGYDPNGIFVNDFIDKLLQTV